MASPARFPSGQLPQPDNELAIERTFRGYQQALELMARKGGIPALLEHLTMINAAIESDRRARMERLLSRPPSASSSIDDPVIRSTPPESLAAQADRARRSQGSPTSPTPAELAPLDRWAAQRNLGRSLASRLAAADMRRRRPDER